MDDEIEILDEIEVTKVVKNPAYKPKPKAPPKRVYKQAKSKPISQDKVKCPKILDFTRRKSGSTAQNVMGGTSLM